MTPNLSSQEPLLLQTAQQALSVSVLLPFEPRSNSKKNIEASMRRLMEQMENQLLQQVSRQQTRQICGQLKQLFDQLDYSAASKSVAFWVSAERGKMFYWNIAVEEAVVISEDFDARRLLAFKKEEKQYLLLVMANHFAGIYLGNGRNLSRLVANAPVSASGGKGIDPTADATQQQHIDLQRSVKHFDNALSILLRAYTLPVFIAAPAAHLACFEQISRNASNATALITIPASINEFGLKQVMASYISNWQTLKEKRLLAQLEQSLQMGKLAVGVSEVWKAAHQKRGKLLLVEEDYTYPAYLNTFDGILYTDAIPLNESGRQTKDAVSDAIEQVLASGGKVEIVGNGVLSDYLHVTMICY